MKKAFTMIELIVVIAILGILMGSMFFVFGNTESARATRCLSNLRNLAKAVQDARMDNASGGEAGYYPTAGSTEKMNPAYLSQNGSDTYGEIRGWINWNSRGTYGDLKNDKEEIATSHASSAGWFTSAYNQDLQTRQYCISKGSLFKYIKNYEVYVCPSHIKKMPKSQTPAWSYVMNGYFGFDTSNGSGSVGNQGQESVDDPHQTLLFAELQWETYSEIEVNPDFSSGSGFKNDCTLQYQDTYGGEVIGFNHKDGNNVVAHIVFADGHVDKIICPREGFSKNALEDLTTFLCTGKPYEIREGSVREID